MGIFLKSDGLQFVISIVGVIVFTGLTAWDAQRLKAMATALPEGQTGSYAVVGALSLYLDFINLFLFMLRFFGAPGLTVEGAGRAYSPTRGRRPIPESAEATAAAASSSTRTFSPGLRKRFASRPYWRV